MECRTCMKRLDLNCKFPFKTKLCIGKTVEEVVGFFIPKMVKTNSVEHFICPQCMDVIKTFMNFIERCITTENYLKTYKEKKLKQSRLIGEAGLDEGKKSCDDKLPKDSIEQEKLNKENIQQKSVLKLASECPSSENLEKLGEKLLKNVSTSNLQAEQHSSMKLLTQIFDGTVDFTKPLRTYSRKNKSISVTPLEKLCNSNGSVQKKLKANEGISKTTENSMETSQKSQPQKYSAVSNENSNISKLVQTKNDIVIEIDTDEDISNLAQSEVIDLTDESMTTPLTSDKIKTYSDFHDFPINESMFLDNCRVVSAPVAHEKLLDFIEKVPQNELDVMKLHSPQETGSKRILFLGNAFEPCLECNNLIPCGVLGKRHYREKHPKLTRKQLARLKVKPSDTPVECPVCKEQLRSMKLFEKHMKRQHKDHHPYKCDECGVGFKLQIAYTRHMENYKLYQDCNVQRCPVCKEKVSRFLFKEHANLHDKVVCDLCGKKFLTAEQLNDHRLKHQTASENARHKRVHKTLCPVCGVMVCGKESAMRTHRLKHTEERNFLCDKCSKMFKTRRAVEKHVRTVHVDSRKFQCSLCLARMKTSNAVKYHMRLKHSNVHSRLCHICGAGFFRNDYYKRHMKRHMNHGRMLKYRHQTKVLAQPVSCKYCDKKFKRISNLRLHLLKCHRQYAERYKCQYCNMSFSSVANLQRHQRRHRDPKMFELTCKVCWCRFGCKADLEAHVLKHKKSQKRKCDECGESFASKHLLQHHRWERHFKPELVEEEKEVVLWEGLSDLMNEDVECENQIK